MIDTIRKGELIMADIKIRYKYLKSYKEEWVNKSIFSRPYESDYPMLDVNSLFFKRFMRNPTKRINVCDIQILDIKNIIRTGFINKIKTD
jgi:hypothetical protein